MDQKETSLSSTLPVANGAKKSKPSRLVSTGVISIWVLLIFGGIAALLTSVADAKSEKNGAAELRQTAYVFCLRILNRLTVNHAIA